MVFLRVNHTQSFRLKSKIQNSRSIQLMINSLFSFFCRLFGNITDVSIANETEDWTRKDLIRVTIQTKGIAIKIVSSRSWDLFTKIADLKPNVSKCYLVDYLEGFFCRLDSCLSIFNFPAKKLRKIRAL